MDTGQGDPVPLEEKSEDQILMEVDNYEQLGTMHCIRGEYVEASDEWQKALSKLLSSNKHHSKRVTKIIYRFIHLCRCQQDDNRTQKQIEKLCECLEMAWNVFGEPEKATRYVELAEAYGWLRDYASKCKNLEQALAIYKNYYGPYDSNVVDTLKLLADAYGLSGDRQKKGEVLERAFAIDRIKKEPHELWKMLDDLASVYERLKPGQQIKYLNEKLASLEEYYHRVSAVQDVATILVKLGEAHGSLRDYTKQCEYLEKALAMWPQLGYNPDDAKVSRTLVGLGDANGSLKNHERQLEYLNRALKILNNDSPKRAATLVELANAQSPRNYTQKCEHLEQALRIYKKYYGEYHPQVARTLLSAGNAYGSLGDYLKQQCQPLEQALNIENNVENRSQVAITLSNAGNASVEYYTKKRKYLEQALIIFEYQFTRDHIEVARTIVNLANAYGSLNEYDKKREHLEQALKIYEKQLGPNQAEIAETLINLGDTWGRLKDCAKKNKYRERALKICETHSLKAKFFDITHEYGSLEYCSLKLGKLLEAIDSFEKEYRSIELDRASILTDFAEHYRELGDYEKQSEQLEKAMSIYKRHLDPEDTHITETLHLLGNAYENLKSYTGMSRTLENNLIQFIGEDLNNTNVTRTLTNVADGYGSLGNYLKKYQYLWQALIIPDNPNNVMNNRVEECAEAEEELQNFINNRKMLDDRLRILKEKNGPNQLKIAETFSDFANAYGSLKDYTRKHEYLEQALDIFEEHYGPHHVEVARKLVILGDAYGCSGNYTKQCKYLERALDIFEHCDGHDVEVAKILTNLADACESSTDYSMDHSHNHLERALEINKSCFGENHPQVAMALSNLASAYRSVNDYKRKNKYLEKALHIFEYHCDGHDVRVAIILRKLADTCRSLKDYKNQRAYLERALIIFKAGSHAAEVMGTLVDLGNAYRDLREYRKECKCREQAFEMFRELQGRNHDETEARQVDLIDAYESLIDEPHITIEDLKKALDIFKEHAPNHPKMARILTNLAYAYGSSGDYCKQCQCLNEALDIDIKKHGAYYPQVAITLLNLGSAYGSLGDNRKKLEHLEKALNILQDHYYDFPCHPEIVYPGDAYESLRFYSKKWYYLKAITLVNLSDACGSLGNYLEQRQYLDLALEHFRFLFRGNHSEIATALIKLADAWGNLKQYEEQCECLEQALHMKKILYGEYSSEVEITLEKLFEACRNSKQYERHGECLNQIWIIKKKRGSAVDN